MIEDIMNGKIGINIRKRTADELLKIAYLFDDNYKRYIQNKAIEGLLDIWDLLFRETKHKIGWNMTNISNAEHCGINTVVSIEDILNYTPINFDI